MIDAVFPSDVSEKFEIHSYRGAATILAQNFPEQFAQVVKVLQAFEINIDIIRMLGGSKGRLDLSVWKVQQPFFSTDSTPPPDRRLCQVSLNLFQSIGTASLSISIFFPCIEKGDLHAIMTGTAGTTHSFPAWGHAGKIAAESRTVRAFDRTAGHVKRQNRKTAADGKRVRFRAQLTIKILSPSANT